MQTHKLTMQLCIVKLISALKKLTTLKSVG